MGRAFTRQFHSITDQQGLPQDTYWILDNIMDLYNRSSEVFLAHKNMKDDKLVKMEMYKIMSIQKEYEKARRRKDILQN